MQESKIFSPFSGYKSNSSSWIGICPARIIALYFLLVSFILRRQVLFLCYTTGVWCYRLQLGIHHTACCMAVEFIIQQASSASSRALDQMSSLGPFQLNLFYDSIFTICFSNFLDKYWALWKMPAFSLLHGLSKSQEDSVSCYTIIQRNKNSLCFSICSGVFNWCPCLELGIELSRNGLFLSGG